MNQESRTVSGALLLALLGGASLGAAAVALTTPKTGQEVRNRLRTRLRTLGLRPKAEAVADGEASDDVPLMQFI
jgi:gas vesicle protein